MERESHLRATGLGDYVYWQQNDRRWCCRINLLIKRYHAQSSRGHWQTEPLKHALKGFGRGESPQSTGSLQKGWRSILIAPVCGITIAEQLR